MFGGGFGLRGARQGSMTAVLLQSVGEFGVVALLQVSSLDCLSSATSFAMLVFAHRNLF